MIRDGKQQGWLQLPLHTLHQWALLQNVTLDGVRFSAASEQDPARGAGVFATQIIDAADDFSTALLTVPRDLILSKERVTDHARVDKDLRTVLESLGEFGQTSRIAILTLLLTQSTLSAPSLPEPHFVHSPFSAYLKYLPLERLPTFWTEDERYLLTGTTLHPALNAKLNSLYREFDTFRTLTSTIPWTDALWWDEVDGLLSFDDWLQVDAMYRSRALEFPGIGDCMAPCIDMANHASGAATTAIYEVNSAGDAVLLLRPGISLAPGQEVTISYGDAQGACEMLFSYAFLDGDEARTLFLPLAPPPDDPLAKAKAAVANAPPGVRLSAPAHWESDWIWLLVVNEEDGLEMGLQRTLDGGEELKALFRGTELAGAADLKPLLEQDAMWDVFRLRAVAVLQARVEEQLTLLYGSEERVAGTPHGEGTQVSAAVKGLVTRLRGAEAELLEAVYASLEEHKEQLMGSEAVGRYLAGERAQEADQARHGEEEEDFA